MTKTLYIAQCTDALIPLCPDVLTQITVRAFPVRETPKKWFLDLPKTESFPLCAGFSRSIAHSRYTDGLGLVLLEGHHAHRFGAASLSKDIAVAATRGLIEKRIRQLEDRTARMRHMLDLPAEELEPKVAQDQDRED